MENMTHVCLFYFSRIDMVHNIFCIDIIQYTKEEFLFRYTSNHTADSNEGCLKTVDVSIYSSIFVVLCGFLAQPLLTAISALQSRNLVATCYVAYAAFFFPLLYSLVFLVTLMLDIKSFILLLVLAVRQEKENRVNAGNEVS